MGQAPKVAPKKVAKKVEEVEGIMAYSVKAKQKVLMIDPVITSTGRGSMIAKGLDEDGNKVSVIMSIANAEAAVEAGIAEYGEEAKPVKKPVVKKK